MKNFVKFLENGEYHYATVKDVGDIDQLVTSSKTDIVSAINEIITKLVGGSGEYDNLDKTIQDKIEQVADEAANKIAQAKQDATDKIGQARQMTAGEIADLQALTQRELDEAVAKTKESIDSANKSIDDANKEIVRTQAELKSVRQKFDSDNDTLNLALKDLQNETEDTIKEANDKIKTHDENIKTINDKASGLNEDLEKTKKDLSTVTKDLENTQIGVTKVDKKVDDVKGELEYKVSQEALDNIQGQVIKNTNDIKVNKEEIEVKADKESVDTLTQDVDKMNGTLKINSEKIAQMVTRESLINDLDNLDIKADNLLVGSREFFNWTISNNAKIHVTNEKFRECKWASITGVGEYISINVDDLIVGATYTLSVGAKITKNGGTVQVVAKNIGTLQDSAENTNVTTTPTQYTISFAAKSKNMIIGLGMTGSLTDETELYVNQPKLEKGVNATGWSVNINDNYTRVEKVEAKQIVQAGQITEIAQKQRDFGDRQTEDETSISVLSDKLQVNSENITKVGQRVTDTNTKIDVTAGDLKANFSKEVNQKIGEISDSSNNQILNSAFTNNFDKWQSISAKAKVVKIKDSNWVEFQQSGSAHDTSIAIQSNYYPVKDQDTVTVAFDFLKKSDVALDNMTVILLEVFDIKDTRVDFKALSVNEFGENVTQDTTMRLSYKYVVNHADAKKMTIKPILYRNGHILFTKFFAKVSTISDGEYTPNPKDMQEVIATQQLAIDANTDGLTAKADKTSVDSLTQTVTEHSSSIKILNEQMTQKTTKTDFDKLTGRVNTAEQKITANADGVTSAVSKIDGIRDDLDNMEIGGTNLLSDTDPTALVTPVGSTGWTLASGGDGVGSVTTISDNGIQSKHALTIVGNTTGNRDFAQIISVNPDIYTFSVYARLNSQTSVTSKTQLYRLWDTTSGKLYATDTNQVITSKNWQRFKWKIDLRGIDVSHKYTIQFGIAGLGSVDFTEPQLEQGTVATDYSRADSDQATVTALNEIKQTADKTYEGLFNSDGSNKIEKTAQGMTAQISTAKNDLKKYTDGAVNGLEIGGNNLLTGTSDWSNWKYNTPQTDFQTVDGDRYIHSKIDSSSSGFSDVYQLVRLKDIGDYTFSFNFKGNVQVFVLTQDIDKSKDGTNINFSNNYNQNQETITSPNFTKFKKTVTISKESMCDVILRVQGKTSNLEFWANKPQLEKGNRATDWGLSASELATQSDVSKALTQSKDYANTTISAKAGEFSTQLTKVKNSIDNMQVGGTNILLGTDEVLTVNGTNISNQVPSKRYYFADGTLKNLNTKVGDYFTLSFDWNVSGNTKTGTLLPQISGSPWTTFLPATTVSNSKSAGHFVSIYKVLNNSGWFDSNANGIQIRLDNFQGTLTISRMKMEKGNIATDYSPSAVELKNSAKTYADTTISAKAGELNTKLTSVKSSIDNMEIGGTNLLWETTPDWVTVNTAHWNDNLPAWTFNKVMEQDTTYTIRAYLKPGKHKGSVQICYADKDGKNFWGDPGSTNYIQPNTEGYCTFTQFLPKGFKLRYVTIISPENPSDTYQFSYREPKLEVGNIATYYSLSPEDLKKYAKTYADTTISAKAGEINAKLTNTTSDLKNDATNKANSAQNNAKSYADTILKAKVGELTAATNTADYRNLFSMNSSGILLDAHGVNNNNKSIILSGDHVVIDSSKPVSIPAASVKGTLTAASFYQYANGTNTWIDSNGFHQQSGGQDTWIRNGIIETNIINAKNNIHVGNYDPDPRKLWGADITKNGMSFTVPVKINEHTSNNASDYRTEIQGYMGGFGWDYTKATAKADGSSALMIGLTTLQDWGRPYGGDYFQLGRFVPTENSKDIQQGTISGGMVYSPLGIGTAAKGFIFQDHVWMQSGLHLEGGDVNLKSSPSEDITLTSGSGTTNVTSGTYAYYGGGRTLFGNRWGDQWIVLQNRQLTNMDNNKLASLKLWELQYGKQTNISQLSEKKDIDSVDTKDLAIKTYGIDLTSYRYKSEEATVKKSIGPIIDNVNKKKKYNIAPEFVSNSGEGTNDHALIAGLIATVQEQQKQISRLEMRMINQEIGVKSE